jgi:hypothetical protein
MDSYCVWLKAYHGETPDLDVCSTLEEFGKGPRLRLGVTTIPVDTIDNELGFFLSQEPPTLVGLVRKVDESPVADDAKQACKSTFDDKDP